MKRTEIIEARSKWPKLLKRPPEEALKDFFKKKTRKLAREILYTMVSELIETTMRYFGFRVAGWLYIISEIEYGIQKSPWSLELLRAVLEIRKKYVVINYADAMIIIFLLIREPTQDDKLLIVKYGVDGVNKVLKKQMKQLGIDGCGVAASILSFVEFL